MTQARNKPDRHGEHIQRATKEVARRCARPSPSGRRSETAAQERLDPCTVGGKKGDAGSQTGEGARRRPREAGTREREGKGMERKSRVQVEGEGWRWFIYTKAHAGGVAPGGAERGGEGA